MTDRRPGRDPSTEHLSDHGLLALTARGDREAFARLYDMYGGAAYALALRIVRDRELSADVVQDAFLTVWKQAAKFDPARGRPSSWILTLTHHKAVDMVRREQRRRAEALDEARESVDPAPAVEQQAWQSVARDQVRAAMAKLPILTARCSSWPTSRDTRSPSWPSGWRCRSAPSRAAPSPPWQHCASCWPSRV